MNQNSEFNIEDSGLQDVTHCCCYKGTTFLQNITALCPRRINPQLYFCGSLKSHMIFILFEKEVINMLCYVHKHFSNFCLLELSVRYNTVIKGLNNLIEVSFGPFSTIPGILGLRLAILLQVPTVWDLWTGHRVTTNSSDFWIIFL